MTKFISIMNPTSFDTQKVIVIPSKRTILEGTLTNNGDGEDMISGLREREIETISQKELVKRVKALGVTDKIECHTHPVSMFQVTRGLVDGIPFSIEADDNGEYPKYRVDSMINTLKWTLKVLHDTGTTAVRRAS